MRDNNTNAVGEVLYALKDPAYFNPLCFSWGNLHILALNMPEEKYVTNTTLKNSVPAMLSK